MPLSDSDTAEEIVTTLTDGSQISAMSGTARITIPSAAAELDGVRAFMDVQGRQVVCINGAREMQVDRTITLTSTAETSLLLATPFRKMDLVTLIMANTSATRVRVDFRDTTGGTVRFSVFLPIQDTRYLVGLPNPIRQTNANTNWTVQLSAAITDVRIFAQAILND